MPVPGGTTFEVVEGGLAPPQEPVALTVALVFDLDIAPEGVGAAEHVDLDRMVDDQFNRDSSGLILSGPCRVGHGLMHGRRSTTTGHAGEVLHDHAGPGELDLGVRLGVLVPLTDGVDGSAVISRRPRRRFSSNTFRLYREGLVALDRVDPVDLMGLLTDCQLAVGVGSCSCWPPKAPSDLS